MNNNQIGWIYFSNDAEKFSESFKHELSSQLTSKFYELLGVKEDKVRPRFALFIGRDDRKTVIRDEYTFLVVDVNSFTYSYSMTIYWKVADKRNLLAVRHKDKLSSDSVEFGWCSDFEKEGLLESLNNKKKLSKEKYKLSFDLEYDYSTYPDLSLTYYFDTPVIDEDSSAISTVLRQHLPNSYVSEISLKNNAYLSIIDFQDTTYKKGTKQLLMALQELSRLQIAQTITKIVIE